MSKPFPVLSQEFFGKCRCTQGNAKVHLVTYHGTQGSTARGGAVTLTTRTDGSAHEVHDSKEGFKLAEDDVILCHVAGANTGNYGIEDATFANWTRKIWFLHKRTLNWSAFRVASALRRNDAPCHFVGLPEAERAGSTAKLNGWTYHGILSLTSWCPSTHSDPAPNAGIRLSTFPHKWFDRRVQAYYFHPELNRPISARQMRKLKKRRRR